MVGTRRVACPIAGPWSSQGAPAGIGADPLIVPRDSFACLGDAPGPGYARWCGAAAGEQASAALRAANATALAFESDAFRARIETMTARATRFGRPGTRHRASSGTAG